MLRSEAIQAVQSHIRNNNNTGKLKYFKSYETSSKFFVENH